jgi:hypothetical protein
LPTLIHIEVEGGLLSGLVAKSEVRELLDDLVVELDHP